MSARFRPVSPALCLLAGLAAASQTFPEQHSTRLYQIVFLKRDPARKTLSKEEADRIQSAHMANIRAMADRGVLVAAGPFDEAPPVISGVFFFVTPTMDEAKSIAAADPTVTEHRNTVEALTWHGPAGIGDEYKRLHKEQPETPEGMGLHPFLILRRTGGNLDETLSAKHAAYLASLQSSGKLLAAGPVEADSSAAEILIFDRIPAFEATTLAESDPAVTGGALTMELHHWWCAAHIFPR